MEADVKDYINLCLAGEIYEYLMEQSNGLTREEVKEQLFTVYYNRKNSKPTLFISLYNSLFPNVYGFINLKKTDNYKKFGRLMQKEESSMVIGRIINRIKSLNDDKIFIASIHDSIVCFECDQPLVEFILLQEISDKYNVLPKLKAEVLSHGKERKQGFDLQESIRLATYDLLDNVA